MTEPGDSGWQRQPISWDKAGANAAEPTQFDEELGRRMARDARRVSAGDLSEAEFHEKYHEQVIEEFGRDDRPLQIEDS